MALSPELHLRQSQSLVMTPQLMQSIKLLNMTAMELEHFIAAELERNPLLERAETEEIATSPAHDEDRDLHGRSEGSSELPQDIPDAEGFSEALDSPLENIYPDESTGPLQKLEGRDRAASSLSAGHGAVGDDVPDFAQFVAEKPTLRHHIHEQIIFAFRDAAARIIAVDLGEQLDESGYFTGDLIDVAHRFNITPHEVEKIFERLQTFDPPGIFARSLSECLALQLKRKDRFDPAMEKLLEYLPALARRDYAFLGRACGVDESDLIDMVEEIRLLDPKPGSVFSTGYADIIIPDALIVVESDGTFRVELNSALLPRLIVCNDYSLKLCANKQEREFLSGCTQNANWLLRALDQRAKTLLTVISEIVRQQSAFLREGVTALKPLNLATIAEKVGMHESTISRVTSNKYLATPLGTFELRYFFSTGITDADGAQTHSAEAVRYRIRRLIDNEDVDGVLSDDAIVDMLNKHGIDIARRTVAKYRESMNIASSVVRRREKKAQRYTTKS